MLTAGLNQEATKELREVLGEQVLGDPKPVSLLKGLVSVGTRANEDEIVLDFFAGSGTTAHAILDLNRQDGANRKFILVQLPEPTGREEYTPIADITKERVRRVIKKLNDEDTGKLDLLDAGKQDSGFRAFKLAESNFTPWNAGVPHNETALAQQLEQYIDHIREGRVANDILSEILLKDGYPLTAPVEVLQLDIAGGRSAVIADCTNHP